MTSTVDICNLALARLGDEATVASIDPPEGSAQAEHCARFYPIARASLLEMHAWKFAVRRVSLAQLVTESWEWEYAYAQPSDALKLISVLSASAATDAQSQDYETQTDADGTPIILTNQADASLCYVANVTDAAAFSPLFVDALAWLLASYLAGPVIKGDAGAAMGRACLQSFMLALSTARTSDSNQRHIRLNHTPVWIADR